MKAHQFVPGDTTFDVDEDIERGTYYGRSCHCGGCGYSTFGVCGCDATRCTICKHCKKHCGKPDRPEVE